MTKYKTILADPPWNESGAGKIKRGADRHLMGLDAYLGPIEMFQPKEGTQLSRYYNPNLRVIKKDLILLSKERKRLVMDVGDGSIIHRFDKTPTPRSKTDVVCPHFIELKWAYGCPFNCSWCFLKGTLRFQKTGTKPQTKDMEKVKTHLAVFLLQNGPPEVLNSGELADSLMNEWNGKAISKHIIPLFNEQNRHKLLLLTKHFNVKNLLPIENKEQIIASFSLNAPKVSQRWEKAPCIERRIEAAKKVFDVGYETRIRIDPMVPIEGWEKQYELLVDMIFDKLKPSRITLGSLRGLQSTINQATDKSWVAYLNESSNWGKKIAFETRYRMYSTVLEYMKDKYKFKNVALCKETVDMWETMDMDYREIRCNCVW